MRLVPAKARRLLSPRRVAAVAVLGAIFSKHDEPLQVRFAEVELGKIRSVTAQTGVEYGPGFHE